MHCRKFPSVRQNVPPQVLFLQDKQSGQNDQQFKNVMLYKDTLNVVVWAFDSYGIASGMF